MQIPDPHYMDLSDWANGTVYALGEYTSITNLTGDDWQAWGMQFQNNPSLGILGPPNPYDYTEWKPWAERLQDALLNASGSGSTTNGPGNSAGTSPTAAFLVDQQGNNLVTQLGQFLVTH